MCRDISPPPPIRFRHIALLVIGGIIVGGGVALLVGVPIWGITRSNFALSAVLESCVYGSWIVGYQRLAQKLQWTDLRTRFAPVGKAILIVSALSGLGLISFIASAGALLQWAGFKVDHTPTAEIRPHDWIQLPVAVLAIVIVGPMSEELLFRGLLLDWLKQKMNVWTAAVILSVIFSLLHANPFSLGAVGWLAVTLRLLLGLTASAFAIQYRSLRPSLMMHGTLNAYACFANVLDLHLIQESP